MRVGIAGAGAWGLALALALARREGARGGHEVVLLARDAGAVAALEAGAARHLPGHPLPDGVTAAHEPGALRGVEALLLAVPAQAMAAVAAGLAGAIAPGTPALSAAKGIERGTRRFMREVLAGALPAARPGALSGPSFAADVAAGLPTAVTLAMSDAGEAAALARALDPPRLRLYASGDLIGAELGGAAKNVLAVAAGAAAGLGLGESARAALVARGFAELRRLGRALGAREATLMGLSGLGDLVLTAASPASRNFAYGAALGRGASPEAAGAAGLAEGAFTAGALDDLARALGVEAPVIAAVAAAVDGRRPVADAVARLLARPLRDEEE